MAIQKKNSIELLAALDQTSLTKPNNYLLLIQLKFICKKKVLDSTRITETASSCGPLGFIVWTLYGVKCHIISRRPEQEAFSSFSFEPKQKDFDGRRVSNKV